MVAPLIWAGAMMAGSQLASSFMQSQADDSPDYGKQLENWSIQQEYNSPANQVARLRAAGLNPNLIYGNGSAATGNASSGPYQDVGVLKSHSKEFVKSLDLSNLILRLKNLEAQANAMNMQADNLASQAEYREAQTKYTNAILDFYDKHGYFPGQSNVPTNIVHDVVESNPAVKFIGKTAGDVVGSVYGHFTNDVSDYPNRDVELAVKAADKRGLKGAERAEYIRVFREMYKRYH